MVYLSKNEVSLLPPGEEFVPLLPEQPLLQRRGRVLRPPVPVPRGQAVLGIGLPRPPVHHLILHLAALQLKHE